MGERLENLAGAAAAAGVKALDDEAFADMRLRENSRSARAVCTFLPRMSCATRLSFCGLMRSMRATAFASLSARLRGCVVLLISSLAYAAPGARLAFLSEEWP